MPQAAASTWRRFCGRFILKFFLRNLLYQPLKLPSVKWKSDRLTWRPAANFLTFRRWTATVHYPAEGGELPVVTLRRWIIKIERSRYRRYFVDKVAFIKPRGQAWGSKRRRVTIYTSSDRCDMCHFAFKPSSSTISTCPCSTHFWRFNHSYVWWWMNDRLLSLIPHCAGQHEVHEEL